MRKRSLYGVVVGIVLLVMGMVLRGPAKSEGGQILLFPPTILAVGVILGRVRLGLLWGFVLTFATAIVATAIFTNDFSGVGTDISRLLATLLFMLVIGAVGAAIGCVGGLIGRLVWKR